MAEPKTRPTAESVPKFLARVKDPTRRSDAVALCALMAKASRLPPRMWGSAIVGFGTCQIAYADGPTLDWPRVAFSPRARGLVLYLGCTGKPWAKPLLSKLGTHTLSRACLYVRTLADVDTVVLSKLVAVSARNAGG